MKKRELVQKWEGFETVAIQGCTKNMRAYILTNNKTGILWESMEYIWDNDPYSWHCGCELILLYSIHHSYSLIHPAVLGWFPPNICPVFISSVGSAGLKNWIAPPGPEIRCRKRHLGSRHGAKTPGTAQGRGPKGALGCEAPLVGNSTVQRCSKFLVASRNKKTGLKIVEVGEKLIGFFWSLSFVAYSFLLYLLPLSVTMMPTKSQQLQQQLASGAVLIVHQIFP